MHRETRAAAHWQEMSACRREDPELFFPIGDTGPSLAQIEEAKTVCRECAVVEPCLQWALASRDTHGIWGATTEAERRRLRLAAIRTAARA
ncbi:WhiB family transcriptional regulator [Streptomyces sp. Act143]|uniref:WhiB family transcriptional regulator n=1 Tax=Streptomyces sp. Act143 TaxID=2200760 RepID=UPI000D68310A|nr:WhiB family transcriptional regulator [Streptomyces sp. Act143]PWI15843.1 WhiB family transcriptional regulator [Streptomyces sp. Act143]